MKPGPSSTPIKLNEDYKEMLQSSSGEDVKFLLVGAYALAVHGFPRATKDIDNFAWASPENATNLMRALERFGAPARDFSARDFASEGAVRPRRAPARARPGHIGNKPSTAESPIAPGVMHDPDVRYASPGAPTPAACTRSPHTHPRS